MDYFKKIERSVTISADKRSTVDLQVDVWSQDLNVTKFILKLDTTDSAAIDLTNATVRVAMVYSQDGQDVKIEAAGIVEDVATQKIAYVMDDKLAGFEGLVIAGFYVTLNTGQRIDIQNVTFNMRKSLLDKDLEAATDNYYQTFDDIVADVQQTGDAAKTQIGQVLPDVQAEGEKVKTNINAVVSNVNGYADTRKQAIDNIVSDVQTTGDTAKAEIKATLPTLQNQVSQLSESIDEIEKVFESYNGLADYSFVNAENKINAYINGNNIVSSNNDNRVMFSKLLPNTKYRLKIDKKTNTDFVFALSSELPKNGTVCVGRYTQNASSETVDYVFETDYDNVYAVWKYWAKTGTRYSEEEIITSTSLNFEERITDTFDSILDILNGGITPERTTFFECGVGLNKFSNDGVGVVCGRVDNGGNVITSEDWSNFGYLRTNYIPINGSEVYTAVGFYSETGAVHSEVISNYAFFDADMELVSNGTGELVGIISPSNAKYLVLSSNYTADYKKQDVTETYWYKYLMLVTGTDKPVRFEPYEIKIKDGYQNDEAIANTVKNVLGNEGIISDGEKTIPDYVRDAAKECANKIESLQSANTFSVAWITDAHLYQYSEATTNAFASLDIVGRNGYVRLCGIGGDNTSDRGTKELKIESMKAMKKAMSLNKTVPMWVCKGNHDDGSASNWSDGKMSDNEIYTIFDKPQSNLFAVNTDQRDGQYCYIDFPSDSVRVFFLNSVDVREEDGGQHIYAFRNKQLNWFAEKLKDTPNGYHVLIMTHISPLSLPSVFGTDYVTNNGQVMFDILKACKNKTPYAFDSATGNYPCSVNVDFTEKDIDVFGIVIGHTHFDNHTKVNDILIVSTIDASFDNAQTYKGSLATAYRKEPGTDKETGYDIFTFDPDVRKVHVTRYGAGVDRVIDY